MWQSKSTGQLLTKNSASNCICIFDVQIRMLIPLICSFVPILLLPLLLLSVYTHMIAYVHWKKSLSYLPRTVTTSFFPPPPPPPPLLLLLWVLLFLFFARKGKREKNITKFVGTLDWFEVENWINILFLIATALLGKGQQAAREERLRLCTLADLHLFRSKSPNVATSREVEGHQCER